MADQLRRVTSYRELLACQKVRGLALDVFQRTKRFPKEEMHALTDQIRRSSRSIGAQIAEKEKMIIPILGEGSFQLNLQQYLSSQNPLIELNRRD